MFCFIWWEGLSVVFSVVDLWIVCSFRDFLKIVNVDVIYNEI